MNTPTHDSPVEATVAAVALAPVAAPVRWLGRLVDWAVIAMGTVLITLVFANVVIHAFGKDLAWMTELGELLMVCLLYTSPSPRDRTRSRMPSSA